MAAAAEPNTGPLAAGQPERAVEFSLPGSWAEPGFRHRTLGLEAEHNLNIEAEEIYLRIKANRNLQNVHVKIAARLNRFDALEPIAEIESADFRGAVTKGREQSFQIMSRRYWNVTAKFTDPKSGKEGGRSIRVNKEVVLFPENPRRFIAEIGGLYYFRVTVHHDDGPDEADFSIGIVKRRDGPDSILKAIKNISPVGK